MGCFVAPLLRGPISLRRCSLSSEVGFYNILAPKKDIMFFLKLSS